MITHHRYTFKELRRHAAADDDCEFTALFTSASKWGDVASVVDVELRGGERDASQTSRARRTDAVR